MRPMSRSQQKRFAVQKDPNKKSRKTKRHGDKTKYKRTPKFKQLIDIEE